VIPDCLEIERTIMPIFDQGYKHWKGALNGHAWRWLAISRHGLRTQLKGRYIRLLLVLAMMPALVLVSVLAAWGLFEQGVLSSDLMTMLRNLGVGENPQAFRKAFWTLAYSFFFRIELGFIMLLVTLAGPNLISLDLRFNALPLYLSRPVTRLDYFFGKLGVIGGLVAAVAVLPAVAAYVLGVCFSLDFGVVGDTWRLLPASILYGMLIVFSAGTLMLALSSLSRRSLYVGLTWVGMFLIGWVVAGALSEYHAEDVRLNHMRKEHDLGQNRALKERAPMMPIETASSPAPHENDPEQTPDEDLFSGDPMPESVPGLFDPEQRPQAAQQRIQRELQAEEAAAMRADWRPLFSYVSNLDRLGEAILDTDAAWVQIGRAYERQQERLRSMSGMAGMSRRDLPIGFNSGPANERGLAEFWVPQYPWTWSAAVLGGLFALSLCILSTRVKSLDRLK
jgi:ABC-2 type transport system permease protein